MDHVVIEHQIERRRKRRRGVLALLGGIAALTLGAGSVSLAQFTDSDGSAWSFTTGSVDINSNPAVMVAVSAMLPGDSATDALTISNDGATDLRYAMSAVATNLLGDTLEVEIREDDVDGGCDDFDGAVVTATTALDGAAFGSNAQGDDAGDRDLLAGTNEVLCFRVSLPLSASTMLQGATSTATFTFDAEQTANNP